MLKGDERRHEISRETLKKNTKGIPRGMIFRCDRAGNYFSKLKKKQLVVRLMANSWIMIICMLRISLVQLVQ